MKAPRPGEAGATRTCPHCKATILESAPVCPACRGHLRFEPGGDAGPERIVPLSVEGTIKAPAGDPLEYTMVVAIRNDRGEEIGRHVVGVGALYPGEARSFSVAVEAVVVPPHRRRARH